MSTSFQSIRRLDFSHRYDNDIVAIFCICLLPVFIIIIIIIIMIMNICSHINSPRLWSSTHNALSAMFYNTGIAGCCAGNHAAMWGNLFNFSAYWRVCINQWTLYAAMTMYIENLF